MPDQGAVFSCSAVRRFQAISMIFIVSTAGVSVTGKRKKLARAKNSNDRDHKEGGLGGHVLPAIFLEL